MTRRDAYDEVVGAVASMSGVNVWWVRDVVEHITKDVMDRHITDANERIANMREKGIPLPVVRHLCLLCAEAQAEDAWYDWERCPRRA